MFELGGVELERVHCIFKNEKSINRAQKTHQIRAKIFNSGYNYKYM